MLEKLMPKSDEFFDDFDAQAEQTFRNLARVLEAGGASLDRVVKVTIFLTDMTNFPKIVELRKRWFSAPYPADTIVERVLAWSFAEERDDDMTLVIARILRTGRDMVDC
jgi:enamine deaminase RidA (YjgF/YER057c/UK114 family)